MTSTSLNDHYRPDIDGMRAIAVVAVVIHHAFPQAFKGGFVGVDIFFVLSGYLISSIILGQMRKDKFSFANFYARRIKRIFPALLLVLITTLVMGWYILIPNDYRALGKHVFAGSTFLSNFAFWREAGYFDAASASKPLLHLWSLAIEEQFYLFWPLLLLAVTKLRWNPIRFVFIVLVLSFAFNLVMVRSDLTAAFYNPLSRFWELMIGALLAAMHTYQVGWSGLLRLPRGLPHEVHRFAPESAKGTWLAWAGVALLVVVFATVHPERKFPGGWALLPTVGTVLLIAAGPHAWFNRHILASKPFVWIGLISYPLYLWHWPFMAYAYVRAGEHPPAAEMWGWIALAVVLSWLTYVLFEIPVRFGRFNRRATTIVLSLLMVGVASAGLYTYRQNGFDERFPQIVRTMMSKGGKSAVIEGWRDGDCMLDFKVKPSAYKDFCIEKKRPLIFLWGDSHAGSLYPGFKALKESGKYEFGLGERAAATCPPILDFESRPLCKSLNDSNIEAIRRSRPDVVILYAYWHHPRYRLTNLARTVQEIKKAGVPRIILLGAVPYWKKPLPQILLEKWKEGPPLAMPPMRIKDGLDPKLDQITEEMKKRSAQMGIEFVSGKQFFCNDEGCLTRISEDAQQPLSYDYGHLTTGAAAYYVDKLAPFIFKPPTVKQ
ncbi:acyltransferase family protein [Hydrogenophaga sp. 5NK40-0174]|uniref:acyltransferase family protein n=1 Tax=Hydrogenophaga sp. 5NK40-0174 TaxID=3127649 RepID=UPI003101F506